MLQPNAWGDNPWGSKRSLRGAVFLNNKVLDEGAVGCFMKGPIQASDIDMPVVSGASAYPALKLNLVVLEGSCVNNIYTPVFDFCPGSGV